jgi:alkylated DNA repair dioxygenase AlkB
MEPESKQNPANISYGSEDDSDEILEFYYGSGETVYIPSFLCARRADYYYSQLRKELEYHPREDLQFNIFGKSMNLPRDIATYADTPGLKYHFGVSGFPDSKVWSPVLLEIRQLVYDRTGEWYNHALINRYCDGSDYIGYHRDKMDGMDPDSSVVVLSFGASRIFRIKGENKYKHIQDQLELDHGSMLSLDMDTNRKCKHSILKTKQVTSERISLTLRRFLK